jgi:anti-anti-sigma factor
MAEVLRIDGDFDAAAARELRPRIETLALTPGDVTIDMSGVEFVDSSGVGALVFLHKRLLEGGHRLRVTGLKGQPLELLTYLRLADKLA